VNPYLVAGALASLLLLSVGGVGLLTDRAVAQRFETVRERRDRQRRERPTSPADLIARLVDRLGSSLAPSVVSLLGPRLVEVVDELLDAAGRPDRLTAYTFAGRKGAYAALLATAGLPFAVAGNWFLPIVLVTLGFFLPDLALRSQAKERQEEIERRLPDFLDVLAVTVSAGLDFRTALDRVADAFEGPLSEEIRTALQQMMLGESRREALDGLDRRNRSESLSEFVTALQQAQDLGAPLTGALDAIAADIRRSYAQQARRQAAKVEPRLSVVMTITLIPAAIIMVGVGFYLSADIDLGGLLGG
jgi:tight adherence protein C